jgi:hypothetical protein
MASASASAGPSRVDPDKPPWIGVPTPTEQVMRVVNPKGLEPYAGPTATVKGRITMKGDPPPDAVAEFPSECSKGAAVYGKMFRAGPSGELADALVAVTGYEGFVPPTYPAVKVSIAGCAFDRRTIPMTFGQRLEISNEDAVTSYMPYLDGSAFRAVMVAVPRGAPLTLTPHGPGQFLLRDAMKRAFLLADVIVLKYATHASTGVDGRYEISGIPAGKARLDVLLPILRKVKGQDVELKEGVNEIDVELPAYDRSKEKPAPVPEPVWGSRIPPPPSASPSAPPAPK